MTNIQFNSQLIDLKGNLRSYALGLTSDPEYANDLVQETMLKALTYRDKFRANTNFKAWLFTILKNSFINHYRKKVLRNKAFDKGFEEIHVMTKEDTVYPSPDSFYRVGEIRSAIEDMEDDYRIPFKMFLEGYKYKEIAEQMDLPLGTVKSRIFFSRKQLKKKLHVFGTIP